MPIHMPKPKKSLHGFLLIASLVYFTVTFIYGFGSYVPHWPDEALFFDAALSIVQNGKLANPTLEGLIEGVSSGVWYMPSGYLYSLAGFFHIFEPSLFYMRLLSFLCVLAAVFLFAKSSAVYLKNPTAIVILSLLILDKLVFRASVWGRMEGISLLVFAMVYFLNLKNHQSNPPKIQLVIYVLKGLLSGIAISIHPFGVCIAIAAFSTCFEKEKKLHNLGALALGGTIPLAAVLFYYLANLDVSWYQFELQMLRKANREALGVWQSVRYLFSQYGSSDLIALTLFCASFVGLLFHGFKNKRFFLLCYQFCALVMAVKSQESPYSVYLTFPMYFGLGVVFQFRNKWKHVFVLALALMVIRNTTSVWETINKQPDWSDYKSLDIAKTIKDTGRKAEDLRILSVGVPTAYFSNLNLASSTRPFEILPVPIEEDKVIKYYLSMDYIWVGGENTPLIAKLISLGKIEILPSEIPIQGNWYAVKH